MTTYQKSETKYTYRFKMLKSGETAVYGNCSQAPMCFITDSLLKDGETSTMEAAKRIFG